MTQRIIISMMAFLACCSTIYGQSDTTKVNEYWDRGAALVYQNALQAIPHFKQGIALAKKIGYLRGLERGNTGISLSYVFSGKYDSALLYIDTAIYYAHKLGDVKTLALVYLNRADAYSNLQNFSAALKDCDTALRYAELSGNKDRLARIYTIMNYVYTAQKQYAKAFASVDRSQELFEQVKNVQMVGQSHYNRALLFKQTDQPDKAILSIKRAIHIADSIGDIQNLSAFTSLLAQVYHTQEKFAEADSITRLSLRYALQTGNVKQQAVAYDMFYTLHMSNKNYARAIEEELKAYAILREEHDLLREKDVAGNLAEAYFKSGNTGQAYKYLQISKELNDSLVKQQFNDETARLQTAFHVAQKDKELQQQKIVSSFIVAGFVLLGIGLLINRYRLRQRMKQLEFRNQIAADLHDEVGSSLSSIYMLSEMATRQSTETVHKDILARMSSNTKETMDKMGDLVWMIKPGETEAGSLRQRIERFGYEICHSKKIEVSFELDDLEKTNLAIQQRKNIYLIFKKALNNAVKYSGTQKIDIKASMGKKQLVLLLKDYGKGFDLSSVSNGNGLGNMKKRTKDMKGKLEITADKGTTIQLFIPL